MEFTNGWANEKDHSRRASNDGPPEAGHRDVECIRWLAHVFLRRQVRFGVDP
ncbi:hypothetical protein SH501x_004315 [Pirellulaceae bacterium SH501]